MYGRPRGSVAIRNLALEYRWGRDRGHELHSRNKAAKLACVLILNTASSAYYACYFVLLLNLAVA